MQRLYRQRQHMMLAGVCAGLARYLDIDPTVIRLLFVLFTIFSGLGLVVYVLFWILIPYEDQGTAATPETIKAGAEEIASRAREIGAGLSGGKEAAYRASLLLGGALVLLGVAFLLRNLNLRWLQWLGARTLWPLLLIALGVVLLLRRSKGE